MSKPKTPKLRHSVRAGMPSPYAECQTLHSAIRLVRRFGDKTPDIKSLMSEFEVSRATAFRWRAAFVQALANHRADTRKTVRGDA